MESTAYTTWGQCSGGCGHTHTLASAQRCLAREQAFSIAGRSDDQFDRHIFIYTGVRPPEGPPGRRLTAEEARA
jgi:hypothetical protein